ncbi:MAG: putative addiction module antidote protein [Epsilonproteobacteria bacterium]|nr:MAG: putative addiction module antidote protein [Campylobacterota bacterium]
MNSELSTFDIAKYLDNNEVIAEYLSQVLEGGDSDEFLSAIGDIARAKGMTQIANDTGLGRESLYKSFAKGAKPKFDTIAKVLDSFGVRLQAIS